MPFPRTMIVSTSGDGCPTVNSTASNVARAVCTTVVAMRRRLRGKRSASAPPMGPKKSDGHETRSGDRSGPRGLVGCFGDIDAERQRLHPRADVRHERAGPEARVGGMSERSDRVEASRDRDLEYRVGYRFRHCGARFSRNARIPSNASSVCAFGDHHRGGDLVGRGLGKLILRVERALAECDDVTGSRSRCARRARRLPRRAPRPGRRDSPIPSREPSARRSSRR